MIDLNQTQQYTLSIRLCADGFSFRIFNPTDEDNSSLTEFKTDDSISMTANLKKAFDGSESLNKKYKRVNVIMASRRYTTIPLDFFDDEQAEIIFHFNHPKIENETICYNILKNKDIVILFGIDKSAKKFIFEQYPEAQFYSQASPLLEYFSAKSKIGNTNKMFVSIRKETIDIFCFKKGKIQLVNSFECNETTDRMYYILYTWKQQQFDQQYDEIQLTGIMNDKEQFIKELRKYIYHVFIMNPSTDIDLQVINTCG
ncbi:MAG: DUF3822 family protein [Bacteroidaceae bacterium]|nr:DUF3822 family protein [Bacteroidaceae bacterium]